MSILTTASPLTRGAVVTPNHSPSGASVSQLWANPHPGPPVASYSAVSAKRGSGSTMTRKAASADMP